MGNGTANSKSQGLRQWASLIFALVAILPLLIFVFTLHSLDVIRTTQAQVSLALALAIALLGYYLFRSMLGRMAEVVQALTAAVEQANRSRVAPAPRPAADAAPAGTAPATPVAVAAAPAAPAAFAPPRPAAASARPAAPAAAPRKVVADKGVPAVGNIREIAEVARTMDVLWRREANNHLGRKVQISVANSRDPLIGTIAEVSDDGLIIDQADGQTAVAYRRVTAIEAFLG